MQQSEPAQGAGALHVQRRLYVILAIAAIVVIAAVVWMVSLATGELETEGAIPRAETPWVTLYDAEGNAHLVKVRTGGSEDAPWVTFYDEEGNAHVVNAR